MDMLSITGAVLPQDTQLQPGSQAGSKGGSRERGDAGQAERDTDRAKKDMLVKLAGEVVQAPRDVGEDLVAAAQARCVALQAEANRLAWELAQTLGPWVLDRHLTDRVKRERSDERAKGRSLMMLTREQMDEEIADRHFEVWVRQRMDSHRPAVIVQGSPTIGWKFGTHEEVYSGYQITRVSHGAIGSFDHGDLSVCKAMADMMARLKGFRMTDPQPVDVLMLAVGDLTTPSQPSQPPSLSVAGATQRLLPDAKPEQAGTDGPRQAGGASPEPDMIWAPVFGNK